MTALLDLVLESHGTLERWRKFNAIDVNLSMHGSHWTRKGWDGVFKNVQLKAQNERTANLLYTLYRRRRAKHLRTGSCSARDNRREAY